MQKPVGLLFMNASGATQLLQKARFDEQTSWTCNEALGPSRRSGICERYGSDQHGFGEPVRNFLGQEIEPLEGKGRHRLFLHNSALQNVIFRFVPDVDEVHNAMKVRKTKQRFWRREQVMRANGIRQRTISGVPLFHVDGLITVHLSYRRHS